MVKKFVIIILMGIAFSIGGSLGNSGFLKNTETIKWNKLIQEYEFGDFDGDTKEDVAIFSYPHDENDTRKPMIQVFDHDGELIAEDNDYRIFENIQLVNLSKIKPDDKNPKELLIISYPTGAHGYESNFVKVLNNKLIPIGTSTGDGGYPDTDFIARDYDNDGKVEILSVWRDGEKNLNRTDGITYYSITNVKRWKDGTFEKVSDIDYDNVFAKIVESDPKGYYTKDTSSVK